jgi:hypothetical protein
MSAQDTTSSLDAAHDRGAAGGWLSLFRDGNALVSVMITGGVAIHALDECAVIELHGDGCRQHRRLGRFMMAPRSEFPETVYGCPRGVPGSAGPTLSAARRTGPCVRKRSNCRY